jgi:segregation and condensation protein A
MTDTMPDPFDQPDRLEVEEDDAFLVNISGYEGPLDLLLQLARNQRVDLKRISILELVEQYLGFIQEARRLRLELAADYLVMAAWLAYLKSRLLLPEEKSADGQPSAQEMAMRLQLQLQRLDAIRDCSARLMGRDRTGRDIFLRGCPEPLKVFKTRAYDSTLYEVLKAYAEIAQKIGQKAYAPKRRVVFALDEALHRLQRIIGMAIEWTDISQFLPDEGDDDYRRSALASTFLASLEMTRLGFAELQQLETFGPLYVRARNSADEI